MIQILACLTEQHDPWVVLAAAALCVTAALSCALSLRGPGRIRPVLAAVLIGAGAWSTHFVALLAYDPGLPMGFALAPTLLSVGVALVGSLAGFVLWSTGSRPWCRPAGGALLGIAIAAMHYLGMTAVRVPGHLSFAPSHVAASLALAAGLGALALLMLRRDASSWRRLAGAVLLVATIVSLHFTGMGGVVVWPDPEVVVPPAALPRAQLLLLVTTITAVALLAALMVLAIEARMDLAARAAEAGRLRGLADAAFEALALLDDAGRVADASSQFARLAGRPREDLIGLSFASLLESGALEDATAVLAGGIPVELRRRPIETASGARTVVALRDLRERIASETRMERLAHHDVLTGLANRTLLRQRLEEEIARGRLGGPGFAVLCLDLDRFKPVNDVYGHAAGDLLLQKVAERVGACLRHTDLCARTGGDEFVILLSLTDEPGRAQALAKRLLGALSQPFDLGFAEVTISLSAGVALFPEDGATAEEVLRAADIALYRAKECGRADVAFFHAGMDEEVRRRHALERDLREAVARGQMTLAWQPQADSATGSVRGFEALLRWQHPERGPVSPGVFIPIAEASGAILQIGAWVLRTAAAEAAGWANPLRVAVNVSALQIQQGDFPQLVRDVLAETGLDPARLEIEVTESLLITDTERTRRTLDALKSLGVQLSLDDFGTGYSSLSMLRNFPFDRVKMDRSFVSSLTESDNSAALVHGILGLSRGLGLPVVAEGVETEAQFRVLKAAQCAEIQGYLIGKPQPITSYDELTHGGSAAAAA
ncbi:EAL domain-containing protein [Roseomonas nepalensis]|uniref:EAL domain-containing protein n=1 Tax=Muricoccus nepalensis TaxID=1854500 RepID=A0A502EJ28_9PROT|nr:EAL domain-containing protein [Roseomonas nepalensis]TPG37497.1 EAL domain-containing protein [Roseomonas nepalensis]